MTIDQKGNVRELEATMIEKNKSYFSNFKNFKMGKTKLNTNYLKFMGYLSKDVQEKSISGGMNPSKLKIVTKEVTEGGYGIVDINGELLLPPVFEELWFPTGAGQLIKAVYKNNEGKRTYGFIDSTGRFVLLTPNVAPKESNARG